MLDHEREEEAVEIGAGGGIELGHLGRREHPRHGGVVAPGGGVHVGGHGVPSVAAGPGHGLAPVGRPLPRLEHQGTPLDVPVGHGLVPAAKPLFHELDLSALGVVDAAGQNPDGGVLAPVGNEPRHDKRLGVVSDHSDHEPYVGFGEAVSGALHLGPVEGLEAVGLGGVGARGRGGGKGFGAAGARGAPPEGEEGGKDRRQEESGDPPRQQPCGTPSHDLGTAAPHPAASDWAFGPGERRECAHHGTGSGGKFGSTHLRKINREG